MRSPPSNRASFAQSACRTALRRRTTIATPSGWRALRSTSGFVPCGRFLLRIACRTSSSRRMGDPNGAALFHDLSALLGRVRCKFVSYPKAKDPEARGRERLKDLNEVLEDYGARGVRHVIERASWLADPGVVRMSELPPLPETPIFETGYCLFGEHYKAKARGLRGGHRHPRLRQELVRQRPLLPAGAEARGYARAGPPSSRRPSVITGER